MSFSPANHIIVIVMDGLGAMTLGPYANAAVATPTWNRLASQSLLVEFAWAEALSLDDLYRAYWYGSPPHRKLPTEPRTLASRCAEAGLATQLITDDATIVAHPGAKSFDNAVLVESEDVELAAESVDETQLVQFALQAADAISTDHRLTWIHSRGLTAPWDAPWELRQNFVDDEDPDAPEFVTPPQYQLDENPDPDEIWGVNHAYAAQLSVADMALDLLLDGIAMKCPEAMIVVTSPRGYALGAHHSVGIGTPPLFSDQLHVPLLIKPPSANSHGIRVPAIFGTHQLYGFLCHAMSLDDASSSVAQSDRLLDSYQQWEPHDSDVVISRVDNEQSIRTANWFLRRSVVATDENPVVELFAKPDDRWDQNEISSRCVDEVRELEAMLSVA